MSSHNPELPGNVVHAPDFITDERDRERFIRASINWLYYNGDFYKAVSGWRNQSITRYFYQRIRDLVKMITYIVNRDVDYTEGSDEAFSITVKGTDSVADELNEWIERIVDFNNLRSQRFVITQHGVISGHCVVGLQFIADDGITGGPNVYMRSIDARAYFPRHAEGQPPLYQFIDGVTLQWEENDASGNIVRYREEWDAVNFARYRNDEEQASGEHGLGAVPFVDWKQLPSGSYWGDDALKDAWEGTNAQNELFSMMYTVAKRMSDPRFWTGAAKPPPKKKTDIVQPGITVNSKGEDVANLGNEGESSIIRLGSPNATLNRLADEPRMTEFISFLDKLGGDIRAAHPEFDLEEVKGLGANVSGYAVRLILGPFIKKVGKLRTASDEGLRNTIYKALKILEYRKALRLPPDFKATDIVISREPIALDNPTEQLDRSLSAKDGKIISRRSAALRSGFIKSESEWEEEEERMRQDREEEPLEQKPQQSEATQ